MFQKKNIIFLIFLPMIIIFIVVIGFLLTRTNQPQKKSSEIESRIETKVEIKKEYLSSIFNEKKTYDDIFEDLLPTVKNSNIEAGIISHHFLAKKLIAEFYNEIGNSDVSLVFLISPDHFNNFFKKDRIAYSSNLWWQTPFGELESEQEIINALIKEGRVELNDPILALEHGIFIEIPFIKKFFPKAKIVPLVLRNNYSDLSAFGQELKKLSHRKSMLIVSSDFSHNVSEQEARKKDKESISILKKIVPDKLNKVTNDCRVCLTVLFGFLNNGHYDFILKDNKTSFDFSGQDQKDVTSYIAGYYAQKEFVKILFLGDLMFDRHIRQVAEKNGNNFIFDKIFNLLVNNDLVVANLEGPITNNKSISLGSETGSAENYVFTFDPTLAKTLYKNNIKLVNLGNNHIFNFGQAGLVATKKYLDNAEVEYFGDLGESGNKSIIKNLDDLRISFISYNQFLGDIKKEQEKIIDEIKKVKALSDIVILYAHWGNEYTSSASSAMEDLAYKFIVAGADLIIGSHSHTVLPVEEYQGKRIYYSLGNFIFDQYFDEKVRKGLAVEIKINLTTKQFQFKEINTYLESNGQTIFSSD